jgi:hypothetical protein
MHGKDAKYMMDLCNFSGGSVGFRVVSCCCVAFAALLLHILTCVSLLSMLSCFQARGDRGQENTGHKKRLKIPSSTTSSPEASRIR